MSPLIRKVLLVLGAVVIAAFITWLPWLVLFRMDGQESQFMGMTMILWAPGALLIGVVAGGLFAWKCWPRD